MLPSLDQLIPQIATHARNAKKDKNIRALQFIYDMLQHLTYVTSKAIKELGSYPKPHIKQIGKRYRVRRDPSYYNLWCIIDRHLIAGHIATFDDIDSQTWYQSRVADKIRFSFPLD